MYAILLIIPAYQSRIYLLHFPLVQSWQPSAYYNFHNQDFLGWTNIFYLQNTKPMLNENINNKFYF